jgi:serine protease AprX
MKAYRLIVVIVIFSLACLPLQPAGAAASVQVSPAVWQEIASIGSADFLVVLHSQADLSNLSAAPFSADQRGFEVIQSLRQKAASSQPALESALAARGVTYQAFWIVNALAVHGDLALLEYLASRPDVQYIESNRTFKANLETPDPISDTPQQANAVPEWGLSKVNAPALWSLGITGQGTVYATADTGVQWDHPALINHYRGWDGATASHDYNWWDAIHDSSITGSSSNPCGYNTAVPCDDYGHGTHVTGTGVGGDSTHIIGMAPGAKWIGCRNMDSGVGRPSTYIDCLQFFIAPTDHLGNNPDPSKRPDVINNSYGCPPSELCAPHSLQAAVLAVRAAGIFMSASAGNNGSACGTVTDPPGLEDSVFSVGAVNSSNAIAGFSSRGPVTIDGYNRLKPALVAPGVGVLSSTIGGVSYSMMSGTSMAAPHVAGAVALLWSAFPALRRDVFATQVLLETTATPFPSPGQLCGSDTPTSVPNNVYGYGLLDVLAAYNQQLANPIVVYKLYAPLLSR